MRFSLSRLVAATLVVVAPVCADTPRVSAIVPRGGQRGTTVELRCYGRNLSKVTGVLFYGAGIEVAAIKSVGSNQARITVEIAKDCDLGEHFLRIRTATGLSRVETFWVGTLPEVVEKEKNDSAATAQAIPLGCTVNGRVTAEDRDWFVFDLKAPMRVNFEVVGVRLGGRDFDPWLAIRDSNGKELATSDNTAFGRMDPLCSVAFEAPGRYLIELREASWGGTNDSFYRLHVGRFPRPVAVVPGGGRPGQTADLELRGAGPKRRMKVVLQADEGGQRVFPKNEFGRAQTPLVVSVVDLPNVIESAALRKKNVIAFDAPAALNGVIDKPGQVDRWQFEAKRGQAFDVHVIARRLRSPLDPVLGLRQIRGGKYARYNDDSGGNPDSRVSFRAPSDGRYEIQVFDQLRRGGPLYVYRVELRRPGRRPYLRLQPAGRYEDHAVTVPRGGRVAARFQASGLAPGKKLEFDGLPPGVTARSGSVVRGTPWVPVVFEAAKDAAPAGALLTARGAGIVQDVTLVRVRNNLPYLTRYVRKLACAVRTPVPFEVVVEPPAVPLIKGAPLRIRFRVKRARGFKLPVRIRMLWGPPGVGTGQVTVTKEAGVLPINAARTALTGKFDVALVGRVYRRGGFVEASTALFELRVADPWLTATLGRTRAEQGHKAVLAVDLKKTKGFSGRCRAELLGVPRDIAAVVPGFDQNATRIEIPLDLTKARPGRHRNLLLRLHVPSAAGEVLHDFRGGEIRVDRPLRRKPAKKAKPRTGAGTVRKPKT